MIGNFARPSTRIFNLKSTNVKNVLKGFKSTGGVNRLEVIIYFSKPSVWKLKKIRITVKYAIFSSDK